MRKEISGGMTEQDARSMLQKRGILAFQALAGTLPQECENGATYPEFTLMHNWFGGAYPNVDMELWGDGRIGEVVGVHIDVSWNWCFGCRHEFRKTIDHDTISLWFHGVGSNQCDVCGELFDDIPF